MRPGYVSRRSLRNPCPQRTRVASHQVRRARALKNSEIAEAMGTTRYVIANYLRAIYDKLGLWNRVELTLWYEARRHREETMN
jgi:hypothetical protein